ncbi:MAG: hypothetical protein ACYC5N_05510, partial [Endomicrobiales bacterium]
EIFVDVPEASDEDIPADSVLREFIGDGKDYPAAARGLEAPRLSPPVLGRNIVPLIRYIYGLDPAVELSETLTKLLLQAFERKEFLRTAAELQAAGYAEYLETVRQEAAALLGIRPENVDVQVTANPGLVREDAWSLATMKATRDADRKTRAATFYVHEAFLEEAKRLPPPEQQRLLTLLARHEAGEYIALYNPRSATGGAFTGYLTELTGLDPRLPQETRAALLAPLRTAEFFHAFLKHLAGFPQSELPLVLRALDPQGQQELFNAAEAVVDRKTGRFVPGKEERRSAARRGLSFVPAAKNMLKSIKLPPLLVPGLAGRAARVSETG